MALRRWGSVCLLVATGWTPVACYRGTPTNFGDDDATGADGSDGLDPDDGGGESSGESGEPSCDPDPMDPDFVPQDMLDAPRLLRRTTLVLAGRFPTDEELSELLDQDPDTRVDWVLAHAEQLLDQPAFYDEMFEFGSDWIRMPPIPNYADAPEYSGTQASLLTVCGDDTPMAGRWTVGPGRCGGQDENGDPLPVATFEPWWAEGTTLEVVGRPSNDARTMPDGDETVDCGAQRITSGVYGADEGCGCGPNLVYCYPGPGAGPYAVFHTNNPEGQRRLLWEEPARLLAHLAWHDRPLDDLILGDYSVGPSRVQSAYVRWGRMTGAEQLDDDDSWWRSSGWESPADPHHDATSPMAWSEFPISARNPYFVAERDVTFDPRVQPREQLQGIPSAGALTSLGMLAAYPRERVRAARMLETFACESFEPPPGDIEFVPYDTDAATTGTCQHCHVRIDPAAIHFKRIQRVGATSGTYRILGVGNWQLPDTWVNLEYPWSGAPWPRLLRSFVPDTRMTPVGHGAADDDAYRLFLDFLPEDQTLLGATSDGTVGPLGFGKLLLDSGAFDRCAVRRLHEHVVGRDIDPTTESGYLDALTETFVDGNREVRSFVRHLLSSESFRRGL